MLVIRTKHDIPTNYLYYYTEEIIEKAERRGFKVKIIEDQLEEKTLRKVIKKLKPRFIFFNGHGSSRALFNEKQEEFITTAASNLFQNTVTFARACSCLLELGGSAVSNGCNAFIGYNHPFWIARNHKSECHPLRDPVARPILEVSNAIAEELLKGRTVQEAVEKSHAKAADHILDLLFSKEPLASASLQALVANDTALDFKGNEDETIV
ncbi:MAG: hypothetical protein AABX82_04970 [Nanoarchaeota archaeon]